MPQVHAFNPPLVEPEMSNCVCYSYYC